jgi:superfamily II DNA or RNA helicase
MCLAPPEILDARRKELARLVRRSCDMTHDKAPQELPSSGASALVVARGWTWRRVGEVRHGAIRRVRLLSGVSDAPDLDTLIEPFDRIRELGWPRRARKVSKAFLQAWVAGWPATAWPAMRVTAPGDLSIALLPHQLSPVLAVVRGATTRLLLADAVGQGKTIEAGLILRELAARGASDRVLILTPLTVRDQWRTELGSRCRLEADVIDRVALRARDRNAPSGLGPFQAPGIALLSIDLAKQPDVLARLVSLSWDALVIDEAHGVCGDSARTSAAAALGARARIVILLSATPHAGDTNAFARLCAIGRLGDEPAAMWFRHRPASKAGRSSPKGLDVSPRRSAEERACTLALGRYLRRLDRARSPVTRLIALVLRKRALSSPAALASSLRHRMAWLDAHDATVQQPGLPFCDEESEIGDVTQPAVLRQGGLADVRSETALLAAALHSAERAAACWSKVGALRRLVRRTRERVLVFTEYRDTLTALSAALSVETSICTMHGGASRGARELALARFADGQARVLIATDVAAEGLNLQHACRLVVHVELPWSPARLEQRNGRVDRLGQRRRVHVWRLLGDREHERRVVAALAARLSRMRAAGVDVGAFGMPVTADAVEPSAIDSGVVRAGEEDDAEEVAGELERVRRLVSRWTSARGAPVRSAMRTDLPWRRVRAWPGGLPVGATIVCLLPASTRGSRPVLIPVHVTMMGRPPGPPSRWLPELARLAARTAALGARPDALTDALRARERALLERARQEHARVVGRWQGSLFERRTARIVEAARADAAAQTRQHQQRLTELGEGGARAAVAVLALLVD